ncbi:Fc receptor-like protein 5 isoform X1 [Sciurus carolinensis]|uniref:Fc receptor-like protein 5 isoform X1 n=1 Tax=Sciurus carolinensis TaxID=30640 RepID=UPI001FB50101|nr:Fc receptor-like protein 5 isoform X1 [Sciurus carolinensis]
MLLWASLLILAPVHGQFAIAPKPVISLHPPWTTVFQGETVNLTCNGFHFCASEKTKWYSGHTNRKERETPGNTLQVHESGSYRCQVQGSLLSNPVILTFSTASLILQGPLDVFEGESVLLRCRARAKTELNTLVFYKNNEALILPNNNPELHISGANLEHNGEYYCAGYKETCCAASSNTVRIQVQVLFPRPVLRTSSDKPIEGSPLTLTCETQVPPQRSDVQLQFRFLRNSQTLGSGWSSSPELQIPAMWREDSGFYSCQAKTLTLDVLKESQKSSISVETPVSRPVLTLNPARGQARKGAQVTFHCEVQSGSPRIRYQFFRESVLLQEIGAEQWKERSASISLPAEHSGNYYCTADNGYGPQRSEAVRLSIITPVSRPVLTLSTPKGQVLEGTQVTLHCEVQRGSPPILYKFYHEYVRLGRSSIPSGGGASFDFSVTAEHSGKYYCTAENSFSSAQRSEAVILSVLVPVSRPVLTLRAPREQTVEGDMVELYCEALRGSPPILYKFYHEDITLGSSTAPSGGGMSFRFSLTAKHSGNYFCEASNGVQTQRSNTKTLSVTIPVSRPVLTLRAPREQTVEGDMVELYCEALRGSPPILYKFYHEDITLGSSTAPSGGGMSFRFSLTAKHSGNYFCETSNGVQTQRSNTMTLSVTIPVSRPVLTLRAPREQTVEGDMVELYCEALRGSPPIQYKFYHEDVTLGSSTAPSGGGASFNLSLTAEHSGNYSCVADNALEIQHSEVVTLNVTVPVSHPVLTLRTPRAQVVVGDEVELHCEALRGSPPILYWFYHEDVTLGNSLAPSGGGASFHLSLTAEHSGNYSCEADNGLGAQRSEAVTLFITGLTESRSGPVASGITGGLLSGVSLVAAALLLHSWFSRKAGQQAASDPSRCSSDSNPQDPTYHNVPGWVELQPVYMNVNSRGEDVVYSEVWCVQKKNKHSETCAHSLSMDKNSSVIYSKVKGTSTPALGPQQLASLTPHR